MKKLIISVMAIAICSNLFAVKNFVSNGNFKDGKRGWRVPKKAINFLFVPADKPEGPCLKVVGLEISDAYLRISKKLRNVSLKPGNKVIIKAKIKCIKLSGQFKCLLRQVDAKGKSLRYNGIILQKRYKCDWKDLSGKFKIAQGAKTFYIYIESKYMGKDDIIYIKDISLENIPPAEQK